MIARVREWVEDVWLQLQVDYEKRQYALYAALGVLSLLSLIPARRAEQRKARLLGRAIGEALNERSPR